MVTTMPTDRDRKKITNSADISGWEGEGGGGLWNAEKCVGLCGKDTGVCGEISAGSAKVHVYK